MIALATATIVVWFAALLLIAHLRASADERATLARTCRFSDVAGDLGLIDQTTGPGQASGFRSGGEAAAVHDDKGLPH